MFKIGGKWISYNYNCEHIKFSWWIKFEKRTTNPFWTLITGTLKTFTSKRQSLNFPERLFAVNLLFPLSLSWSTFLFAFLPHFSITIWLNFNAQFCALSIKKLLDSFFSRRFQFYTDAVFRIWKLLLIHYKIFFKFAIVFFSNGSLTLSKCDFSDTDGNFLPWFESEKRILSYHVKMW